MQVTRTTQQSNINIVDSLQAADGKVSKAEFQKVATDQSDSSQFISAVAEMTGTNYDCATGTWKKKTLTANISMTISNAKTGEFYVLLKSGAFTLTLPTGGHSFPTDGNVVPAGTYEITFGFDGTNYSFAYQQKTII